MQMRDALRLVQGASATDALATSFGVSQATAQAVVRAVVPKLLWPLETQALSRNGLADIVEAIGRVELGKFASSGDVFRDAAAQAEGQTLLGLLLPGDAAAVLAVGVARQRKLAEASAAAMLRGLAVLTLAGIAERARPALGALLAQMPSLGAWSKGSPHADLADILRRGCGAGPYAPLQLRRAVRRHIGRACSFGGMGLAGWYTRFILLRPLTLLARPVVGARS